jgi:hypothetical protein
MVFKIWTRKGMTRRLNNINRQKSTIDKLKKKNNKKKRKKEKSLMEWRGRPRGGWREAVKVPVDLDIRFFF